MTYGMTYDQFWRGDTMMTVAYREAWEIHRDNRNAEEWLQGMYNYDAFGVVLSNAFRKKGANAVKYAEQPYRIRPMTEAEKEAEQQKEIERTYAWFDSLIAAQNAAKDNENGGQN